MRIVKAVLSFSLLAAVLMTGCQVAGGLNTEAVMAAELEGSFLVSHLAEDDRNTAYSTRSRAVLPDDQIGTGIALPASGSAAAVTMSRAYPEQGQTSTYVIAREGSTDIYDITVTTNYGGSWVDGVRRSTVESYRIKDGPAGSPDGSYKLGGDDLIVDAGGTASPRSRIAFETTYRMKRQKGASVDSVRRETIEMSSDDTSALARYASLAGESLDFDWDYAPPVAATVNWSSLVTYTQEIPARQLNYDDLIDSSAETYYLEGRRYYTELGTSPDLAISALAVERVFDGPNQTGRLIATLVTRSSYSTTASGPGATTVESRATYYLDAANVMLVEKSGSGPSTPVL